MPALLGIALLLLLAAALAMAGAALRRSAAALRGARDATDRLQRRIQELEAGRTQAQAILDSMGEAVAALDAEGRVLWLNASAQRLLGLPSGQAAGKRLVELFRHPELGALVEEAIGQRRPAARELRAFGPDEQLVRFQATPCDGGPRGAALVLVAQDVTEIRRLEQMRREFVANMSHELKTPITAIKSLAETLLNGAVDDPAHNRRFLGMVDDDANRLARLVDDLLELSHIESKAAPLKLQPVRVGPLIDEVAGRMQPPLRERGLTLELALPADAPPVLGDPERLRQIFVNLLDNAIKFNTRGGRITVRARPEQGRLRIDIEDTGIGIPAGDLPRVFERFYRADKARAREQGGTGLGLAIVKHLVDLHHGAVSAESAPGRGSTFTLLLPISRG